MNCFRKQIHSSNTLIKNVDKKFDKNIDKNIEDDNNVENDTNTFQCGFCKTNYYLEENKIKIYCGGCEQYFCCAIAGECIGDRCKAFIDETAYRTRYCVNCVKNILVIGETCICKDCFSN